MIFNSFEFVLFFIIVFVLYWWVLGKTVKGQNILLLLSSIFFYAWADWRFLGVLVFNILFNFFLAKKISKIKEDKSRQVALWLGVAVNVGVLGYYKYFNFFYENFLHLLGAGEGFTALNIIIPLGISFFTFQSLGYIIDVYYEDIKPYNNLLLFSTYMTFFPKLLSGPIERAQIFIPQITFKRKFDYEMIADGFRQILWGLFAKIVIAENCAVIVNPVFENYQEESGSTLLVVSFFYMIQLYADFSGYSNMAIGVGKLLGIKLSRNFATPFYSTNISGFWRKWHMSLTLWLMDYIFTPLSFILREYKKIGLLVSVVVTFLIVGLWHGANWTYVVFGLIHGLLFIPVIFKGKMSNTSVILAENKLFPSIKEAFKMGLLFFQVSLVAVFFRSETVVDAFMYLKNIFSKTLLSIPWLVINGRNILILALVFLFLGVEWLNREKQHDLDIRKRPIALRWSCYIIIFLIIVFAGRSADAFIYFQF